MSQTVTDILKGTNYGYETDTKKTTTKAELGKDDFLSLLVTQLQYQDPTDPQDNSEFVAQMAQFTTLEQMQNMSSSSSKLLAYSMTNKTVEADIEDDTTGDVQTVSGTVTGVEMGDDGNPYLLVNGKSVALDEVTSISDTTIDSVISKLDKLSIAIDNLKKSVETSNSTTTATK